MFKSKAFAALPLVLGLLATPAIAQPTTQTDHQSGDAMMGAGGMPGGMMRMIRGVEGMGETGGMGMGMGGMRMMAAMAGHVEGRLAFIKTELKITDAQLAVWNKFADAVRDNAKAMEQAMQTGMTGASQSGTLPDRLARREKIMAAHLEALRNLTAAVDPLYAALSPEQKKTADELMPGPMGMVM